VRVWRMRKVMTSKASLLLRVKRGVVYGEKVGNDCLGCEIGVRERCVVIWKLKGGKDRPGFNFVSCDFVRDAKWGFFQGALAKLFPAV